MMNNPGFERGDVFLIAGGLMRCFCVLPSAKDTLLGFERVALNEELTLRFLRASKVRGLIKAGLAQVAPEAVRADVDLWIASARALRGEGQGGERSGTARTGAIAAAPRRTCRPGAAPAGGSRRAGARTRGGSQPTGGPDEASGRVVARGGSGS